MPVYVMGSLNKKEHNNHLEKICQESDVQIGKVQCVIADAYQTIQPAKKIEN